MITILQLYSEFNYTISAVALKYIIIFTFFSLLFHPSPPMELTFFKQLWPSWNGSLFSHGIQKQSSFI